MPTKQCKKNDDAAEVGIGTMIVFIATILVAAVAAGVLIDTSQKLQDKSTRTGNEATSNVGTSLTVESVLGTRAASPDDLEAIEIYVTLSPGAESLDLSALVIQYNDGAQVNVYSHGVAVSATEFTAEWIRGAGTGNVMESGDFVKITVGEAVTEDLTLANNVKVDVNLVPSTGSAVSVGFTTPPSYGTKLTVDLF